MSKRITELEAKIARLNADWLDAERAFHRSTVEVEALRAENARLREAAARMGRQLLRSDDDL